MFPCYSLGLRFVDRKNVLRHIPFQGFFSLLLKNTLDICGVLNLIQALFLFDITVKIRNVNYKDSDKPDFLLLLRRFIPVLVPPQNSALSSQGASHFFS
jgi:hypothetical protein